MSNIPQNNKVLISQQRVELFCLFVTCSCTSMEGTVLSCCFKWLCSSMPKVMWNNKSTISMERFEWFCWAFFGSSYLHRIRYLLKQLKLLFSAGIVRHPIRLSDILNLKTRKLYEVSSLFFASLEAAKVIMLFWVVTLK